MTAITLLSRQQLAVNIIPVVEFTRCGSASYGNRYSVPASREEQQNSA